MEIPTGQQKTEKGGNVLLHRHLCARLRDRDEMRNNQPNFIEMIMLSGYVRTRMWVGSVTFPGMGPIKDHYVLLMSKCRNLYMFSVYQLLL